MIFRNENDKFGHFWCIAQNCSQLVTLSFILPPGDRRRRFNVRGGRVARGRGDSHYQLWVWMRQNQGF
jgi:hypothetical protein